MSAGLIVSIILILLLLAAGIVFLVLYLRERNNKPVGTPNVSIQGEKFTLKSNTEVEASWTSVGDDSDMVTLYASKKPIQIGSDGKPTDAADVLNSSTVQGNQTKSVSITNLVSETRYYLALVVFNQISNIIPETIFTDIVLEGEFTINEIDNAGFLVLDSNLTTVRLDPGKTTNKSTIDDIWEFDNGQFGGTPTFTIFSKSVSDDPETVLYNNNGTLAATQLSSLSQTQLQSTAQWEFTTDDKPGQWCLRNASTKTCMIVSTNPTTKPVSVQVGTDSKTQWINKTVT